MAGIPGIPGKHGEKGIHFDGCEYFPNFAIEM